MFTLVTTFEGEFFDSRENKKYNWHLLAYSCSNIGPGIAVRAGGARGNYP